MTSATDNASSVDGPSPIARQLLIDWANQQDGWVRALVGEVLATRQPLSPTALAALKDQYLREKKLAAGDPPAPSVLGHPGEQIASQEVLHLHSLRNCTGVNALATDQEIIFGPRMTILFGENASGKTGYVRALKFLANVRSAEPIVPDIHHPTTVTALQALLRYSIDGTEHEMTWLGDKGVPPFTRISVFDSPAVTLHLSDGLTYVYTPADLALYKHVHSAIESVRDLLQQELTLQKPKQNELVGLFVQGTAVYPKIEGLGVSTDLNELDALANVTEEERIELETLRTSVQALSNASSATQIEGLRTREAVLRNLIAVSKSVAEFDLAAFEVAVGAAASARSNQAQSAAAAFKGDNLPTELRPAWQAFLEAGEHYLSLSAQDEYPHDADVCIYCNQELDGNARALLTAYRDYARGVATQEVKAATDHVITLQAPIMAPEVASAIEGLRSILPGLELGEQPPTWLAEGKRVLASLISLRDGVAGTSQTKAHSVAESSAELLPRLVIALQETGDTVNALEGTAADRAHLLAEQRVRIAQLESRLLLGTHLSSIHSYVEQMAWVDRFQTLLGHFSGLLRNLTEQSKLASENVLNRDFERAFVHECKSLRAPTVTLDFPGRKGEAARRKSLARSHSLSEILSEGEQRVIALADFLAETSLRSGSAPVIFDDPVTSLDHRRIKEIAHRIADLSTKHQVVVFTHDIWFVSELLALSERSDCLYYQVLEDGGRKGIVSPNGHPRLDTEASVRKQINLAIDSVTRASGDNQQDRIDSAYSHIRTWCEIVVESELLNRVTQRYQPNVAMQKLLLINTDRLATAIGIIYPIWEKANRYIPGHSQPLETLGVRPTPGELRLDWQALQSALSAYKQK